MSTRSSLALLERDGLSAHLYREMHDGAVHLALESDNWAMGSSMNVIIPEPYVEFLSGILKESEGSPEEASTKNGTGRMAGSTERIILLVSGAWALVITLRMLRRRDGDRP